MKRYFLPVLLLGLAIGAASFTINITPPQTSQNDGWQPLFNGKNLNGWHSYGENSAGKAWEVKDGVIHLDASKKKEDAHSGGDLVSNQEFENFDLKLDWKISPGGNSGIIFYVHEDPAIYKESWNTGLEMQIVDNEKHPDAKIKKHRAGDLYDLISCNKETVKPAGEWNHAEIISNKGKLQLFLNGTEVVSTTLWNDNWKDMVAHSKFASMPGFGKYHSGKIALQDHGFDVWFKNIRIKRL